MLCSKLVAQPFLQQFGRKKPGALRFLRELIGQGDLDGGHRTFRF
jgi:hypothetical protein